MSATQIPPDVLDQLADAVARRVVALLDSRTTASPDRLVSATTLAAELGVTRAWVYAHKAELGARTLTDGPRPRLRFPLPAARQPPPVAEAPKPTPRRTARLKPAAGTGAILAIRPPAKPRAPRAHPVDRAA